MMRALLVAGCLWMAGCAGQPAPKPVPVAPTQICPPDPPVGSNLQCAPPKACQLDPKFLALIEGPLGDLVPAKYQKYRDAVDHLGLAVQDLCQ